MFEETSISGSPDDDLNIWEKSHLYLSTGSEVDTLNVVISSQWELSLMLMLSSSEGV